jgi:hypothetical protein
VLLFLAGQISIALNFNWFEPKDKTNPDDLEASEIGIQFWIGWYAHPILVNGDYPEVMKMKIDNKSKHLNYSSSRLPKFTEWEKQFMKGKNCICTSIKDKCSSFSKYRIRLRIVCNITYLCALCTWTIYFKVKINKNNCLHICTVACYMYLKVAWKSFKS